ncbi:MAG: PaREP1 family protein [Chloroflexi bacterium]|nr:PaREP1 family protein [Chloroflexota bacterium]
MTTTEPIESHAVHSQRMLDHAAEMIEQGDRLQASEKIWGAAAHRVKQIAAERNWPNTSHTDGWSIIQYLRRQTGNRRIVDLFGSANDAHQNFYEDRMLLDGLTDKLEGTRELLALLDDAHRTLPSDLPMPDDRHYRNRHA